MTVKLKWNGDRLMLGRTVMAGVRREPLDEEWVYVIGPRDLTSERYEKKDDCRKDCEAHVRRLLSKAGAPDA